MSPRAAESKIIQPRYVVLGRDADTEAWRRARGLSWREVIRVSTRNARALRGISGRFEVVELPSWEQASPRVRAAVQTDLVIASLSAQT